MTNRFRFQHGSAWNHTNEQFGTMPLDLLQESPDRQQLRCYALAVVVIALHLLNGNNYTVCLYQYDELAAPLRETCLER